MRKEAYEKEIARLEQELASYQDKVIKQRDQTRIEVDAALQQRDGLFVEIHDFMNRMYRDLGQIQSGLLKNMQALNDASIKTRTKMIDRKMIAITPNEDKEIDDD